jgi:hypothetical protein
MPGFDADALADGPAAVVDIGAKLISGGNPDSVLESALAPELLNAFATFEAFMPLDGFVPLAAVPVFVAVAGHCRGGTHGYAGDGNHAQTEQDLPELTRRRFLIGAIHDNLLLLTIPTTASANIAVRLGAGFRLGSTSFGVLSCQEMNCRIGSRTAKKK